MSGRPGYPTKRADTPENRGRETFSMKATHNTKVNGRWYRTGEEIPEEAPGRTGAEGTAPDTEKTAGGEPTGEETADGQIRFGETLKARAEDAETGKARETEAKPRGGRRKKAG